MPGNLTPVIDRPFSWATRRLVDEAGRLTAHRPLPLDLRSLLDEHGIELRIEQSPTDGKKGGLERSNDRWAVVVRMRDIDGWLLGPRERFTIAHEFGHFLVNTTTDISPRSNAEYWSLEEVCNAFAAALLVPDELLRSVSQTAVREPYALARVIRTLTVRAKVSLEVAARRALQATEVPAVFGVLDLAGPTYDRPRVRWLASTIPSVQTARGSRVSDGHPLWPAVAVAMRTAVGEHAPISLISNEAGVVFRLSATVVQLVAIA